MRSARWSVPNAMLAGVLALALCSGGTVFGGGVFSRAWADEAEEAQKAVDDVPEHRVRVVLAHDEVREERRRHDEQHHAQHEPQHHGRHHGAPPELHLLIEKGLLPGLGPAGRVLLRPLHHLKRPLRPQRIDHRVRPPEVVPPRESFPLVSEGAARAALDAGCRVIRDGRPAVGTRPIGRLGAEGAGGA